MTGTLRLLSVFTAAFAAALLVSGASGSVASHGDGVVAHATQSSTVYGAMLIQFENFRASFGYQQHQCHRCHLFSHCCGCFDQTACFLPAQEGSACNAPVMGGLLFSSTPTATVAPGQSVTMSPDGSTSCNAASQSGFGTPSFPLGHFEQSFTCTMQADGSVVASNVQNPGWLDEGRVAGTVSYVNGPPVPFGACSVATATYTGAAWTETGGGNQGCSATTGTMSTEGSFTARGYCCLGVVPMMVPSSSNSCFGMIIWN